MTAIKAAEVLLKHFKKPMTAKQLAKEILNRKMVHSTAIEQINSISATILKTMNQTDNINLPLCFWNDAAKNKLIGLKVWKVNNQKFNIEELEDQEIEEKTTITLPSEIVEKLRFTHQSNIKDSFEEYVVYIVELGLEASEDEVKEAFDRKLKETYGF